MAPLVLQMPSNSGLQCMRTMSTFLWRVRNRQGLIERWLRRSSYNQRTPPELCRGQKSGFLSIGPILDDRLKEKLLKSWKGAHSSHLRVCVCLSVRPWGTDHTFWPRNLIFGLSDPWDMRKKRVFFVFRNFHFYAFYRHFSILSS